MTALLASGLTVKRGGRAILAEVSLALEGGGFVGVVGPNGSGKSTLLACLAGLIAPDIGEVRLDGRALRQWKPTELAALRAYTPQNPRCEWPISVERLVALGLTPVLPTFGGLPAAMEERIARALAVADLTALKDQPATTLSGGEFSRAMLARALVGDPALLIVDEPTTGLDPRHAIDAMRRLACLAADGRLVIAALHDLTLAARYCDTVVMLSEGRLAAHGGTRQVLTAPVIRRVFGVEARIEETAGGPLIDLTEPA